MLFFLLQLADTLGLQVACASEGWECVDPPPPADHVAWWIWLAILAAIAIADWWLLWKHRKTLSQQAQRYSRAHQWFRWLGMIALGMLGWHLFFGFPWDVTRLEQ